MPVHGGVEMELEREWRFIRHFRAFVESFMTIGTADEDLAQRVSMTVTELLENAVKYGTSDKLKVQVQLIGQPDVYIRVVIEHDTLPDRIRELQDAVEKLRHAPADDLYQEVLQSAATGAALDSKVGLARIRTEGEMTLRCESIDGGRVRLIAERFARPI